MSSDVAIAATLSEAEYRARETGEVVEVPNPGRQPVPPRYERSPPPLSMPKGENAVYRTAGPKEHYQLRVYQDRWTVEFDQYHPKHYPGRHAVIDAPMYTAVAAATVSAFIG